MNRNAERQVHSRADTCSQLWGEKPPGLHLSEPCNVSFYKYGTFNSDDFRVARSRIPKILM